MKALLLAGLLTIPGVARVYGQETPSASSLSGVLFDDKNANGIMDEEDRAVPAIIVDLLDSEGNFVARILTDDEGKYTFPELAPGIYFLRFEFSPGFAVRSRGLQVGAEDLVFVPVPVIHPDSDYSFSRLQLSNPANFKGNEVSPFIP